MLAVAALLAALPALAQQDDAWLRKVNSYWDAQDTKFRDPARTPLLPADQGTFNMLDRYMPDERYRVTCKFIPRQGEDFGMPSTGSKRPIYRSMGVLTFMIDSTSYKLTVYQNRDAAKDARYANHLFVPFTDLTNGETTYGGGRYIDLIGPLDGTVVLDFNLAYNPLCAYGGSYNCPIPPKENHLNVAIKAGVKAWDH